MKAILPLLQVELQQAKTASEDKAAALQADVADLQERLAAAEADLAAAQARVQQLEQQLQAQQAEAAASEKRMNAQMEQVKMDVSCCPLCSTMHILSDTLCFCICLLMPYVSPLNFGQKRKEKTTPFGVSLLRSQVLYQAAQAGLAQHIVQRIASAEAVACVCILTSLELYVCSLEAICDAALNIERLTASSKDQTCTVDNTAAALPHLAYAWWCQIILCATESLMWCVYRLTQI